MATRNTMKRSFDDQPMRSASARRAGSIVCGVHPGSSLKVDAALFGRVERQGIDYVIQPRLLELKNPGAEPISLEPITAGENDWLAKVATLASTYARTLKVPLSDAEARRMDKASQPTRSLKAFELFARAQMAVSQKPGQEGNEAAVDLLARAIKIR